MAPSAVMDDDNLLLLSLLAGCHFRVIASILYDAEFKALLPDDQRKARSRRIPRCALVHMDYSSYRALYISRNDQSFITFTGLDYKSFQYLLTKFRRLYNRYSPYVVDGKLVDVQHQGGSRGRPRSLDAAGCLGLALGYTRTKGGVFGLQMIFGVSYSVLLVFLKYSLRLLYKVLLEEDGAKVQLPPVDKIAEYQEVIGVNYPALEGTWCVMDGLKLQIQKSGDETMQNAYYNGWLHDHLVGSVYIFAPSGLIVACCVNAPGSWHDSIVAENGGLYSDLKVVHDATGGKCVADSAFSLKQCPFIIKSGKRKVGETAARTVQRRQATHLRQSAEWGMRAIQGSFPRLKDRFIFSGDPRDRQLFMHLIPLLLNFRTNFVGLNQLQSTFYPDFEHWGDNVYDMF